LIGLSLTPAFGEAQRGGDITRVPPVQGGARGRVLLPEQQVGQAFRRQLQLSDAQVPRLQELNQRYNERRRVLLEEERAVRMQIRETLCGTDSTRGGDMSRWIDQLFELERRRLDLRMEEQRDLGAFLTPYQRARYLGMAEQIGRRLEEQLGPGGVGRGQGAMRGAQRPPLGGGPPPGGPPMGPPDGRAGPPPVDACGNPLPPGRGRARGGRGGEGDASGIGPRVYMPFLRP
jgi:hypothetical protein